MTVQSLSREMSMLRGLTFFQKLVAAGFGLSVLAVYAAAGVILLRWGIARLSKATRPRARPWIRWAERAVVCMAVVGLGCAGYAYRIEPYWIDVTHRRIQTAKLPAGAKPVRIVHLSDLHCDPKVRAEDKLVNVVAAQHPDVIVFTGDAANSSGGVETFRRCVKRLAGIAPVYGVRGNWDYFFERTNPLAGTALRELDGEAVIIGQEGSRVVLVGFGAARRPLPAIAPLIPRQARGLPVVLLTHYPGEVEPAAAQGVDLCLAGHTHGGQVALPGYGALVTLARHGKRFESGLHRVGDTRLYVSRGIGMEGGPVPRVRFCARPEVAVIEVAPAP